MTTWQTLHNSHEKYEHLALIIKLCSVALVAVCLATSVSIIICILLLALLWVQEGIWKTYQARTCDAIINLEQQSNTDDFNSCLLYSEWQSNRPSSSTLIREYIKNTLKPTVMFPYLPLMVILLFFVVINSYA